MAVTRVSLTKWTSVLAPVGRNPWGEFGQLGRIVYDPRAGRTFKFVAIDLSGVSAFEGAPVVFNSAGFGHVTPDVSDCISASHKSLGFAGVLVTSTTIVPVSGSTAFGWILTNGPLGKLSESLIPHRTLKTFFSASTGGNAGETFRLSTADGRFVQHSQQLTSTSIAAANLLYVGSGVGTSARTSVSDVYVRSLW